MPKRDYRKALRGVEDQAFDIMFEAFTVKQWTKFLNVPLELAAAQGKLDLAQKLMDAGAKVGDALHVAVESGHVGVARILLESGAPHRTRRKNGETPLLVAARLGHTEMVELLLLKGSDKEVTDVEGNTPFFAAISNGHLGVTQALLAAGVEVNHPGGKTEEPPIFVAVELGHVGIVRALLQHGTNVGAQTGWTTTPLHIAAQMNNVDVIDVLVEYGADIEAESDHMGLPLHCAAMYVNLEALVALLKHGANVNAMDDSGGGVTPLCYATSKAGMRGAAEIVDTLLRSGADETVVDLNDDSLLDAIRDKINEGECLGDGVERVYKLLANAPADRAWRRRGFLVLCRAGPDRVQLAHTEASGRSKELPGGDASAVSEGDGDENSGVIPNVVGLQEEGIFRMIVGFL